MELVRIIGQVIVALGILNVWIVRYGKSTEWRAGTATNMREEFEVYGIPFWAMMVIGGVKVTLALLLIVGIWVPALTRPAALCLGLLMLAAVGMHIKVKDSLKKALPAVTLVVLCFMVAAMA
ncbi:MAG: DoxX family protein [bacterium]|nr:DoxX family protein [bacterium]